MVRSSLRIAFTNDDLPTFGRPMMATLGHGIGVVTFGVAGGLGGFRGNGKVLDDGLHQLGDTVAVAGGDRVGFAHAQRIELHAIELHAGVVELVDGEHDRLAVLKQFVADVEVAPGYFGLSVQHKDDDLRFGEGQADLFLHLAANEVGRVIDDTPGVDHAEGAAVQFRPWRRRGRA